MWVGCSPSKAGEGTACCSKVVEVSGKHTCKRVNPGLASWVTLALGEEEGFMHSPLYWVPCQ